MKRPPAHQIDELAQRALRDALPPSWIVNQHDNDYGKDYLIEIGEDAGELTGSSFYVQLKGHKKATFSAETTLVKHSLESKYARYYVDKVRDLPVFLVVVEVATKKGWWLFLQQALDADQSWRKQDSATVHLPIANAISNSVRLREHVEDAKKWMRLRHPDSISEVVVAHKERIIRADPRFNVQVSLIDDQPTFTLLPKEAVPLRFEFAGEPDAIREKVQQLFDKGALVAFEAGEVKITGTELFRQAGEVGCQIQFEVTLDATVSIVSTDKDGTELARLNDIPGRLTGGQKELWFEGALAGSPLAIKFGPVPAQTGGSCSLNFGLHRWDGQRILQLAYFDRLKQFFQAMPTATSINAECAHRGNAAFSLSMSLQQQPFAVPLAQYLDTLAKGRRVCARFNLNPPWSVKAFDRDAQETFNQMDAILFCGGWTKAMPNLRVRLGLVRNSLSHDLLVASDKPEHFMLVSAMGCSFMGQSVELGRVIYEFREVLTKLKDGTRRSHTQQQHRAKKPSASSERRRSGSCELLLIGTKNTVVSARLAEDEGF